MPAQRRIIVIWLPRLQSELALRRLGLDAPFAMIERQRGAERLVCLNAQAEGLGLSRGMGLADARAICPDLLTRPADPHRTAQTLESLRRWALRYCPWAACDGADGLALDITGAAHLMGGEAALRDDLLARLARMGFTARAGLADTRGAAWAMAHVAGGGIIAPGSTRAALGPLPLAALRLDAKMLAALERLGLRRVRDLAQMPRAPLARRFGATLLQRLDQAMGDLPEPVAPPPAPPVMAVRLSLPDPIGLLGDLQAALTRLLERLCQHLHRAEMGARRLVLDLSRVDGQAVRLEIRLARPMRDAGDIAPLFDRALDGVDAGFGIDAMRLCAPDTSPLPLQQVTTGGAQAQDDLADLISRLGNRLGFDHVQRLLPADSHIPEKAFTVAAAAYSDPAPDWPPARTQRPLVMFPPEPIAGSGRALPRRFKWRGQTWQVVAASGPERLTPEWWLDDPNWRSGMRDYWRVQTDRGARLWLFHTPQRDGWCVQGEFA
ncbi:DNA polymerase Y family protein [Roseibaca sp. Y0-43]|uniref:DNA polymerase Y family protein n=1 Tax=Roseibaca sp. Y0-43 TaxID=2816854 RepID=UPI001D0C5B61|nr:DNA polymerase Y family protein [Roseibaca sp. Y0-43]MCC1481192.1 DNA polymerase Y family protein [Roseibaca sp. Y0-43]